MRTILLLCVLALGCGNDDVHHLNDGGADAKGAADAAPDAPPVAGPVSVTVTEGGSGVSGAVVYFLNADNSVVAEKMTDGSGVASANMVPGGSVTVLEPAPQPPPPPPPAPPKKPDGGGPIPTIDDIGIVTWVGVKPGDDLRDDLDGVYTGPTDVSDFSIVVPTDTNPAVTEYFLFTTCQIESEVNITPPVSPPPLRRVRPRAVATNDPVQIELEGCGSATDMVVETLDKFDNLIDTMFVPGVAVATDTTLTLTGTYAPAAVATYSFTNAPAEIDEVELVTLYSDALLPTSTLLQVPVDNDFDLTSGSGSGSLTIAGDGLGAGITTVDVVDLFGTGNIADLQQIATWGSDLPTDVSIDIGATRLSNWVTTPVVDPIDQLVSWTTTKAGQQPDYLITYVQDFRPDAQTGANNNWHWVVFAPGSEDGAVVYPQLPTDVFDFNWRDTDDVFVGGSFDRANIEEIGTVGVQSPGGYDAARDLLFDALPSLATNGVPTLGLTGSGQVVAQLANNNRGIARRRVAPHHRVATRDGKVTR